MYIIYNTDNNIEQLRNKYLLLELDTIEILEKDKTITAYAVIDTDHIQATDVGLISQYTELHANLIKNYKLQNWNYCEQVMEHLTGCFRGEIDTFYDEIQTRITELKEIDLDENWTGVIKASSIDSA